MADRIPRFEEGPAYLEDMIDLSDAVKARTVIAGPGIKASRGPNGTRVEATGVGGGELRRIQIPAGGIASGASASCFYYKADHTLSSGGDTITVWNRWSVSVGGVSAKDGLAGKIAIEANEWHVIQELC
jgi:hypothetical protein